MTTVENPSKRAQMLRLISPLSLRSDYPTGRIGNRRGRSLTHMKPLPAPNVPGKTESERFRQCSPSDIDRLEKRSAQRGKRRRDGRGKGKSGRRSLKQSTFWRGRVLESRNPQKERASYEAWRQQTDPLEI